MLRRAACLLICLLSFAGGSSAQRVTPAGNVQPRILLLLDGSSSMLQPWNNSIRFKAAAQIVAALMDSIYSVNAGVEFGLRVYGHQSPAQLNDCFDSRMEVMFSKNNATQMGLRLASLHPFGVSPIAYSLKEAAENDLTDEVRNAYSVILITDGGESCGGNICEVVKMLIDRKITFKPYILGLVNHAPLKQQYACLGTYLQVTTDAEIGPAINTIVEAYRPVLSMPIMAARTESAAPDPKLSAVNIPAWKPDRSSVAPLTLSTPITSGLPITRANRSAPRRLFVPPLNPIARAIPEPVLLKQEIPAGLASTAGANRFVLRYSRPRPVRLSIPRPTAVARSIPEPQRTAEEALALLSSNNRPTKLSLRPTYPLLRRIPVPTPGAVTRSVPEAETLSSLATARPTQRLGTTSGYPVLRRISVPQPTPVTRLLPEAETVSGLSTDTRIATIPLRYSRPVPRRIAVPRPTPVTRILPDPETVSGLISDSRLLALSTARRALPVPRRVAVPRPTPVTPAPPEPAAATPPVVKRDTVAATKPTPAPVVKVPDTAKSSVVIKKLDPPVVASVPKRTIPVPRPATNAPKEATFTTETEEAKETSLAILFTDGRGKFYASTPQLQLTDAATGKLVKQFYRTIDAAGNPDPQSIPPGNYNLLVAGRSNMLMRRIVVEKNKMNKIIVKVSHGSLRFRYEDAPDRPVTEFDAIVNIRFEPGPTVKQRCTAELEYAPGNYYIEINTLPISRFNTDIDFGAITEIQIPESGYVQFTNTTQLGAISLYTPLGNKFVRFHGLRITGDPDDQRLRLKPGLYEVHWVKNPNLPFAPETIERFTVKSNSVTEVELR